MSDDPVIVIGSGPCGAVAAHKLVDRGLAVTMLDAGSSTPRGAVIRGAGNILYRRYDWTQYLSDRHHDDTGTVDWYSSLSHGGLSNYWTAAVPRFAADDFTEGGRLDERYVWPLGYAQLKPYYAQAEQILNVTTGDPIVGVPSSTGSQKQHAPSDWAAVVADATSKGVGAGVLPMAIGNRWMFARRATEFSSYQCVIEPLLESPRFRLRGGAHVTRLLWNSERGAVDGVEFVDLDSGRVDRLQCRAVVLAAGTIDSTAIVLRSTTSDFPNGLGNSADLVGRYLTDHPREWWQAKLARPMRALSHPLYLARAPHAESEPLMATSLTIGLRAPVERLRTYVRARTSTVGVQVFGTQIPRPDLALRLDDHPDPARQRVHLSHAYDDSTRANLMSARQRFVEVLGESGLTATLVDPGHELRPGSSVHFAGSMRMHTNPAWGVLDGFNRMHDVPNVVVTDMSAFTTNPEKNPTLTAMALSLRAADRLADDLS